MGGTAIASGPRMRIRWCFALLVIIGQSLAASAAPAQSPRDAVEAGFAALQEGDGAKAASIFRDALTTRPGDPVLLLGAGAAAHLEGREQDAIRFLKQSVQVEPRQLQAAVLLGEIAYHEGDLDLAIKTYETALKHAPSNMAVRERLQSLKNEGSLEDGRTAFKDDRFSILFDGPVQERLAARASQVLGAAFWRIGKTLGAYPSAPINVILYSRKQFRDVTGAPEWAGGGFDGQIRLPVAGASQNLADFDRVLTHELTHAILKSLAPRNLPAWLNEGLALQFDGTNTALDQRRLTAARLFVPLRALQESFSRLTAAQAAVAYAESGFAARVLIERAGPGGIGLLLQDLYAGQTFEEAVQRFGFTAAEFEAGLVTRVGAPARSTGGR